PRRQAGTDQVARSLPACCRGDPCGRSICAPRLRQRTTTRGAPTTQLGVPTCLLRLLRRLYPHLLGDCCDDSALLIDGCRESGRPPWAHKVAGTQKARPDGGIAGHLADIGGNPLATIFGHVARTEQSHQSVISQRSETCLFDGRDGGLIGNAHAVTDG